jgi:hypothetical protein
MGDVTRTRLEELRTNLRDVTEISQRSDSVDQLWLQVGALTAVVDEMLGLIKAEEP